MLKKIALSLFLTVMAMSSMFTQVTVSVHSYMYSYTPPGTPPGHFLKLPVAPVLSSDCLVTFRCFQHGNNSNIPNQTFYTNCNETTGYYSYSFNANQVSKIGRLEIEHHGKTQEFNGVPTQAVDFYCGVYPDPNPPIIHSP